MITGDLRNKIDRIWETFWTGGITNPLDVIEQFTYLLFIKQLDDVETTKENEANFLFNMVKDLKQKIIEYFNLEKIEVKDATYLTNARQNALIKNTISYIDQALEDIENEVPVDMIEINIRAAWDTLGEIIGATYKDELLDELFSNFCLGK